MRKFLPALLLILAAPANAETTAMPLILEQTARWYLFGVPFGLGPLAILLIANRTKLVKGWKTVQPGGRLYLGGLLLFGLWVVFQPLGWQLRVDREGIRLRAPVEIFSETGSIRWKDLTAVRFALISSRYSSRIVEFESSDGTVLTLKSLGGVPSSYWAALGGAIDANAPPGTLKPDAATWIERAVNSGKAANLPLAGYVATDGAGRKMSDRPM